MAERLKAPVLKTGVVKATVGSNPTLPATCIQMTPIGKIRFLRRVSIFFLEAAPGLDTEAVLIATVAARVCHEARAASSSAFITYDDAFLGASRTVPPTNFL